MSDYDLDCPRCGGPITYNGNYYCQAWDWPWDGQPGTCDWALPHPQDSYQDRLIAWQLTGEWEDGDVIVSTRPKRDEALR